MRKSAVEAALPRERACHREEGEDSAMAQPKDQESSHP
jgi:hypothetical protein